MPRPPAIRRRAVVTAGRRNAFKSAGSISSARWGARRRAAMTVFLVPPERPSDLAEGPRLALEGAQGLHGAHPRTDWASG